MMALKAGSLASVVYGTLIYTSLQFKLMSKSLEDLSNMEDSDNSQIEQNTFSTVEEQHRCEEFNYRDCQVYATDSHFGYQAKHRCLNFVTYTSTETQASLLLTVWRIKNIRKVLTNCFLTINHRQKTVLKPLLKITKRQFGKNFAIWLGLFVVWYKSQFISILFSTTHFLTKFNFIMHTLEVT